MTYIELSDGTELFYDRQGEGRPIVFVHGLFGLTEHWQFQLPVFARTHTVLAYDFRGSGRSSKEIVDVHPIALHASDLREVLTALDFHQPVVLVGHSMGSCIVIEFALRWPDRVAGLSLISGFSCGEHCGVAYEQMKEDVARKGTLVSLFKRVSFGKSFEWHPEGESLADWAALEAAKLPVEAIYANARGFTQYDARPELTKIKRPTLVIVGDQDWSCPLDPSSRYLAEHLDGHLEVIHCGHFPMLEAPAEFNELLGSFLGSMSAS